MVDAQSAAEPPLDSDVTGTGSSGIEVRNYATNLTVNTGPASTVTGGIFGIQARNNGTGAMNITANGDVSGTNHTGINAINSATGTDLDVTTGIGTAVSGNLFGISAKNYFTGALTVTANGDVAGTTDIGIYALNTGGGTDLSVTTGAGSSATGGFNGIVARNEGSGALTVTANGDVYGGLFEGIFASNSTSGTDLTVTSGASTMITGVANGMNVRNYGTGALTVTANGDVTGIGDTTGTGLGGIGIYAQNFGGTSLDVTTGAASAVTGSNHGIFARNYGTGAFSVTANGEMTGDTFDGIFALQGANGTDLSVTTGAGSAVTGNRYGIAARNYGTGALAVTANGDVTGTNNAGIYARHFNGGPIDITVGPGATASGGTAGVQIAEGAPIR